LYAYRTRNRGHIISKLKALILLQFLVIVAVIVVFASHSFFATPRRGVVTGILYTIENSTALIDKQIVKEGDTIYGVTVVKIHRNDIEFEKNGRRWKQRVGQRPNGAWAEDEDAS